MHSSRVFLYTTLFLPALCLGADAFENGIPLELVEQFTGGQISPDLPVDFPDVDLPESVSVMGSLDNNFNQIVVFRSTEPGEEAGMAIAGSFEEAGWIRLLSFVFEQQTNGFVYPNQAPLPVGPDEQFCHDRYGTMTVSSPAGADDIVNVRLTNQALMQPGFSCQEQNEQRQRQQAMGRGGFPFSNLQNSQYIPRLELPVDEDESAPMRTPFRGLGGFSGSDNDVETQASVAVEMTAAEVNAHFAEQLEAQGWTLDSDWAGEFTAGGNWSYSPEQNLNFIGILSVIERSEGLFDLKFRMLRRGTSGNAGGVIRSQGFITNDAPIVRPAAD